MTDLTDLIARECDNLDALMSELSNLQQWCALMARKDSGGIPACDLVQRARIALIEQRAEIRAMKARNA